MTPDTPSPVITANLPDMAAILARLNVHSRLGEILVHKDRQAAREAAIVARWMDDGTAASLALRARADSICRYLGVRTHG